MPETSTPLKPSKTPMHSNTSATSIWCIVGAICCCAEAAASVAADGDLAGDWASRCAASTGIGTSAMVDCSESTDGEGALLPKLSTPQLPASLLAALLPSLTCAALEALTALPLQGWAAPQVLQPARATSAALLLAWSSEACCCCGIASAGRAPLAAGEAACCPGAKSLLLTPAASPALLLLPPPPEAPGLVLLAAMLPPLSAGEPARRTRSSSPRTDQRLADVTRTSATLPNSPGTGSSSTCRRTASRHHVGSE